MGCDEQPWVRAPLRGLRAYAPPDRGAGGLLLDLNEGAALTPRGWLDETLAALTPEALRRYPDARGLEARLAERLGVEPARVLVTNGGDDAIDRVCRACLGAGDEIVLPSPTFEMIGRSAELAGGVCRRVGWMGGAFPVGEVLGGVRDRTRVIAVVSPNNPTGGVITGGQLRALSAGAPRCLLMVDLAYAEFADEDLTGVALSLPNAVVVRTFSKAYGLAGLRVGYAAGAEPTIAALRAAGGPFPCSACSLAVAGAALDLGDGVLRDRVARVRAEREEVTAVLRARGVEVLDSKGNFVLARFGDSGATHAALGGRGVRVKRFEPDGLRDWLRIGMPGDPGGFAVLMAALDAVAGTREGVRS